MGYSNHQSENSVNRFMGDFFHSTIFKVVATLVGLLVCFFCSSFLCIFLGFGNSLFAAVNGISKSVSNNTSDPFTPFEVIPTFQPERVNPFTPTAVNSQVESHWVWRTMELYQLQVEMPEDWVLEEINRRQVPEDPMNPDNKNMLTCAEYRIISPDRMQVINISRPCGWGEGFGEPCPENIVIARDLGNDDYLYREPNQENNSFLYGTTHYGPVDGTDPLYTGYWCMNPPYTTVEYKYEGKSVWEIQDLSIADQVVASFLVEK